MRQGVKWLGWRDPGHTDILQLLRVGHKIVRRLTQLVKLLLDCSIASFLTSCINYFCDDKRFNIFKYGKSCVLQAFGPCSHCGSWSQTRVSLQLRKLHISLDLPDPYPQLNLAEIQSRERMLFEAHAPDQAFPGLGNRAVRALTSILERPSDDLRIVEVDKRFSGLRGDCAKLKRCFPILLHTFHVALQPYCTLRFWMLQLI